MKTRPQLEAEALRLIAAVNDNIVLDAKEVLVRALDQMWVDGARWAAEIASKKANTDDLKPYYERRMGAILVREAINEALENREKI